MDRTIKLTIIIKNINDDVVGGAEIASQLKNDLEVVHTEGEVTVTLDTEYDE